MVYLLSEWLWSANHSDLKKSETFAICNIPFWSETGKVFGCSELIANIKPACSILTEVVIWIYDHYIVVATVWRGQPLYWNWSVCRFKTNVFGRFYHIRAYRFAQDLAKLGNSGKSSTFRKYPESTRAVCRHLVVFGAEEELWSSKKLMGGWWCREV